MTNLTNRFQDALVFAAQLHAAQARKASDVPYVAHLLAVTAIVLEHGGDEDEAMAALLHDAVEDQGGRPTLERIRRRFGDRVAEIVEGCSDSDTLPKPPWHERKQRYLEHLAHASASVRLVSAADKLHNARAVLADHRRLGAAVWQRFNGRRDGTLGYYRALVEVFKQFGSTPLVEELQRVVTELEQRAREEKGTSGEG